MSTVNQNRSTKRIAFASLVAAAAAVVTGTLGAAAPANAIPLIPDGYAAIAVSNLGPQVAGVGMGMGSSGRDQAEQAADNSCHQAGGDLCTVFVSEVNKCVAVAVRGDGHDGSEKYRSGTGSTRQGAERAATIGGLIPVLASVCPPMFSR